MSLFRSSLGPKAFDDLTPEEKRNTVTKFCKDYLTSEKGGLKLDNSKELRADVDRAIKLIYGQSFKNERVRIEQLADKSLQDGKLEEVIKEFADFLKQVNKTVILIVGVPVLLDRWLSLNHSQ